MQLFTPRGNGESMWTRNLDMDAQGYIKHENANIKPEYWILMLVNNNVNNIDCMNKKQSKPKLGQEENTGNTTKNKTDYLEVIHF